MNAATNRPCAVRWPMSLISFAASDWVRPQSWTSQPAKRLSAGRLCDHCAVVAGSGGYGPKSALMSSSTSLHCSSPEHCAAGGAAWARPECRACSISLLRVCRPAAAIAAWSRSSTARTSRRSAASISLVPPVSGHGQRSRPRTKLRPCRCNTRLSRRMCSSRPRSPCGKGTQMWGPDRQGAAQCGDDGVKAT